MRRVFWMATVMLAGCEPAANLADLGRFQVPPRRDQAWVLAGEDSRPAGNVVCLSTSGGQTVVTIRGPGRREDD